MALALPRPQLLIRGVGGDPVEPAPERRLALEGVDLPRRRPEGILHDLLRVLLIAGDTDGEPIRAVAVCGDEGLGGAGLLAPQLFHEPRVPISLGGRGSTSPRLSQHPLKRGGIHVVLPRAGGSGAPGI